MPDYLLHKNSVFLFAMGFEKNIPWLDIANSPALLELKDNAITSLKDTFQITLLQTFKKRDLPGSFEVRKKIYEVFDCTFCRKWSRSTFLPPSTNKLSLCGWGSCWRRISSLALQERKSWRCVICVINRGG